MRMNNFLLDRKSIREYKNRSIGRKKLRELDELKENIRNQSPKKCFDFILFENGKDVYKNLQGQGGYNGNMIESPHYIGVRLSEVSHESMVLASLYTEELITGLIELDLGTCWVTIKDASKESRVRALGEENKNIAFLISLGHPKPKNPFDIVAPKQTMRDSFDELIFLEELDRKMDFAILEERGLDDLFYYVKFAPSTKNSQPWRFVLKGTHVDLYLKEIDQRVEYMDAGIIMYYFQILASYMGIYNKWTLAEDLNTKNMVKGYKKIGEYKL